MGIRLDDDDQLIAEPLCGNDGVVLDLVPLPFGLAVLQCPRCDGTWLFKIAVGGTPSVVGFVRVHL